MGMRQRLLCAVLLGLGAWQTASAADITTDTLGTRFVRVPAGEFVMGTGDLDAVLFEMPEPDPAKVRDETPAHRVVMAGSPTGWAPPR